MQLKDPYIEKESSPQETLEKKRNTITRKVFSSQDGRWWLLDMCKRYNVLCGVSPVNLDPQSLAYEAGAQAVLTDIIRKMTINPIDLKQEMAESE